MNPWDLSASELLVWGIVLHLIGDWVLQNDWMAQNKMYLKTSAAGYAHAWIHAFLLLFIFGWMAILLGFLHLLIDTRKPVLWWSRLIRQTQPRGYAMKGFNLNDDREVYAPLYDVGLEVRIWTDQVMHIICIAVAALLVA